MPFTRHLKQIYVFNWWWGTSSLGTVHETTFKKINEIDDSNTNHARNKHISRFLIFILSNILEQNQDYHGQDHLTNLEYFKYSQINEE